MCLFQHFAHLIAVFRYTLSDSSELTANVALGTKTTILESDNASDTKSDTAKKNKMGITGKDGMRMKPKNGVQHVYLIGAAVIIGTKNDVVK